MNTVAETTMARPGVILSDSLREQLRRAGELSAHDLGVAGESLAATYLHSHGWDVVERNWCCAAGEADIIAIDPYGEWAFVEVKTRYVRDGLPAPVPEVAVDAEKRRRYRQIAQQYLATNDIAMARFDVIAVSVFASHMASVHHVCSAFGCDV